MLPFIDGKRFVWFRPVDGLVMNSVCVVYSPFKKWVGAGLARQSPSQLIWSRGTLNPAILSFYYDRDRRPLRPQQGSITHHNKKTNKKSYRG